MADEAASDEDLLRRFVAGERSVFDELVRRHEDRIYALTFRMTGNEHDALDAAQETFISAFQRAGTFRADSSFGTWLYRIGITRTIDLLRKRKRSVVAEVDDASVVGHEERLTARVDLARALEHLPEEFRTPILMYDIGDISYEEIALTTKVSIGTVKSRISRGRRRLAGLLEQPASPTTSKERA